MAKDRPRKPAYKIFAIKRRFQQSKSRPPTFKETCAHGRQRGVPPKSGYFTAINSCNAKKDADRCTHAAYHNKH